mgnify:CR=1 FL=1
MKPNQDFMQAVSTPLHEQLLGEDPQMQEVRDLIARLAQVDLTVLIVGETGTGKDIAARLLHRQSSRYRKPFIKVNCPSIPEGILESELFGYERGAFTGAHTSKPGRFELANGGTIFLDEVSETSHTVQSKLLQVLDGEPYLRIGGTEPIRTDARVVAATNIPMGGVAIGRLRQDVAYRLSEVVVRMPSLRERRGDIPLLAEHFNYNLSKMLHKEYHPLEPELLEQLRSMDWPGNIRELGGSIKRYVATGSASALIEFESTAPPDSVAVSAGEPGNGGARRGAKPAAKRPDRKFTSLREAARLAAEKAEKELIEETLRYTLWNRRKAAKLLQTSYSSLLRRISEYEIGK